MTVTVYLTDKQKKNEANLLKSFRSAANRQAELSQSITADEPFLLSDPGMVDLLNGEFRCDGQKRGRHEREGGRF